MSQLCGSGFSNRSYVTSAADSPNEAATRKMPPITGATATHLSLRTTAKAFSMNLIVCIAPPGADYPGAFIDCVRTTKICARTGANYALTRGPGELWRQTRAAGRYIDKSKNKSWE